MQLPAAQCPHDDRGIGRTQRLRDIEYLVAVDEESHVRAHHVLLQHAEPRAVVVTVEVGEQFPCRNAKCPFLAGK